jgi:hypothetical protein
MLRYEYDYTGFLDAKWCDCELGLKQRAKLIDAMVDILEGMHEDDRRQVLTRVAE